MKGLTKRQREIVDYIQEFIGNNRYSPSYREIGQHFGFNSLGSVYKHIGALKRKGALTGQSNTSRSITPASDVPQLSSQNNLEIPLIGHIAAGEPVHTFPQSQQIVIPHNLAHAPDKTYALRAQGESLNEEMIADGDLLIVEARQHAYPGETVIALINGHDTIVKKYYPEGDYIRLVGAHFQHHPMILRQEDILIQGVLVGLLRQYG